MLSFQVDRKPSLRPNAVPRIFAGVPTYLSKPAPEARPSPSKRRRVVNERHDTQQEEWLDADRIESYEHMTRSIEHHLRNTFPHIHVLPCEDNILLYNLDGKDHTDCCVSIPMTIRILPDMTVRIFIKDQKLPSSELKWALSHTKGIVLYWSQLDNILTRYGDVTSAISSATTCKMMAQSIQQLATDTDERKQTLSFIAEQLTLVFAAPKGRRYTTDMLIVAFTWYHKSPACYRIIQRQLVLLSVRLLRDVASHLNVGDNNTSYKYLCNKVKYLEPTELLVTLQLDEIHIKPKVSYQNGQLYGNASNRDQQQANRIQTFMISSVLSSNKDVVSLVPVQKMNAHDLYTMTQEVIKNVTTAGYRIVAIISDNNVINRKMFMELSGSDTWSHTSSIQSTKLRGYTFYLIQFTC